MLMSPWTVRMVSLAMTDPGSRRPAATCARPSVVNRVEPGAGADDGSGTRRPNTVESLGAERRGGDGDRQRSVSMFRRRCGVAGEYLVDIGPVEVVEQPTAAWGEGHGLASVVGAVDEGGADVGFEPVELEEHVLLEQAQRLGFTPGHHESATGVTA